VSWVTDSIDERLDALAEHPFRARFHLRAASARS
jgi:hypothetical protein